MQASEALPAAGLAKPTSAVADKSGIRLLDFAVVALQLALVLVLFRQFQIEGKAFIYLAAFAFAGFAVHAFLPLAWRLPFFAGLSLASIALVVGLVNAGWIVAIGVVLVGICHLPLSVRTRVGLLLAVGAVLMAQRSGWLPIPWSEAIWPVVGAMFMFRLIVYFYDLRHDKTPVTAAQSVSYFAMLPNVCFPLFPVIDFKTWRRGHYSADAYATYQKGVDWIVRGVVHLILYRYFYLHVTLAPSEVDAPADLMQYIVANFMSYLRVSGLFHLIVGLLHLFGFSLPETHNRYLLASSLTDHWRRINIYWKDFMQKVFYYPAVFALKRLGTTKAIVLATLYVFVLTWFLHSYQWFWLRGSWLFTLQDMLFWAILGVLVVITTLYEMKHGRSRTLAKGWSWRSTAVTAAKAFGTFWLIAFLWSLWNAESVSAWVSMLAAGVTGPWTVEVLFFPLLVLAIIVLGLIPYRKAESAANPSAMRRLLQRDMVITVAIALALLVTSIEAVHTRFGPTVATLVHSLRAPSLSRHDYAKLERGYYEGLLDVGRFNSGLWELMAKKPSTWLAVDMDGLKRFTGDFAQTELVPSSSSSSQYGMITTNRHGLRDKEYADVRPAGTLRIAVLGPSTVMGWGVPDGGTFEALLEQRLAEQPVATGFNAVELLNFGVPGYQPPQQLRNFERALALQPNAVIYVAGAREQRRSASYLAEVVRKRIPIPYQGLQALVEQAGVNADMEQTEMLRRLEPLGGRILQEVYRALAERSREQHVAPIWVFLPQLREAVGQEDTPEAQRLAEQAGFAAIDLTGVFAAHEVEAIRLAEWDEHPNALGHRLVAERLHAELAKRGPALFDGAAR